ncbi:MAG: phosphoribosylaminoimidazolesuccinocarboxamide synthase [Actinomycetota bacterium]|nr:MAG: phosphoribosylaminoimidazolesuccinocarboxamide synthase [Actinomycetota bacterium]
MGTVLTLKLINRGKVRDLYRLGDPDEKLLLMVASDRVSAFDVVMKEEIRDKGKVLTAMTEFWFEYLGDRFPNHIVATNPTLQDLGEELPEEFQGRAMLVREAEMLPIECIVRGYLAGSALKEYQISQTVHGQKLPDGLSAGMKFPKPLFTPSTKAESGHDINISFGEAARIVGADTAARVRDMSIQIYEIGARRAEEVGVILADTKFEFGFIDGEAALCDEILTPDSSRIWEASELLAGGEPTAYDKQPLRDWLESVGWNKLPPPPSLSVAVQESLRNRYIAVYERISGREFLS